MSPTREAWSLNHWTTGNFLILLLLPEILFYTLALLPHPRVLSWFVIMCVIMGLASVLTLSSSVVKLCHCSHST